MQQWRRLILKMLDLLEQTKTLTRIFPQTKKLSPSGFVLGDSIRCPNPCLAAWAHSRTTGLLVFSPHVPEEEKLTLGKRKPKKT